jgi:hypothetical protein
MPDEPILGMVQGLKGSTGIAVATDRRLIFVVAKGFRTVVEEHPYTSIQSVAYETGLVFGALLIRVPGPDLRIERIPNSGLVAFAKLLSDRHLHRDGTLRTMQYYLPVPPSPSGNENNQGNHDANASDLTSWTLPGFRRKKFAHVLGGMLGYALVGLSAIPLVRSPIWMLVYLGLAAFFIMVLTNYRGTQSLSTAALMRHNPQWSGNYLRVLTGLAVTIVWLIAVVSASPARPASTSSPAFTPTVSQESVKLVATTIALVSTPTIEPTAVPTSLPVIVPTIESPASPTPLPPPLPTLAPTTIRPAATAPRTVTQSSKPCLSGQVKGNANSNIFHMPGGRDYTKTSANVVCFDSATDAEKAGYKQAER